MSTSSQAAVGNAGTKTDWKVARDEWIKDQLETLIRSIVGHLNDQQHKDGGYYSYQEVRELIKSLI